MSDSSSTIPSDSPLDGESPARDSATEAPKIYVKASFIDVGQGDCSIFADSLGRGILVDCPSGAARLAVRSLEGLGVARLSMALITHWDADHFGGVLAVASAVGCNELRYNHESLIADVDTPKQLRLAMLLRLAGKEFEQVQLSPAVSGERGSVGYISWIILGPNHRTLTEAVARRDRNRGSVIIRFICHSTSVIIGGDADAVSWSRAMHHDNVAAEIMRSSHHGAMREITGFPTITDVLSTVNPKYVVVSVGSNNTYGHPHSDVIQAAGFMGVRVLCTEATGKCRLERSEKRRAPCAGDIEFLIDGDGINSVSPDSAEHRLRIETLQLQPLCRLGDEDARAEDARG